MQEKTKLLRFILSSLNHQDFASIPMVSNIILTPEDLEWIFSNDPIKSREHFNRMREDSFQKSPSQGKIGLEKKTEKKVVKRLPRFEDERAEQPPLVHTPKENGTSSTQESIKEEDADYDAEL